MSCFFLLQNFQTCWNWAPASTVLSTCFTWSRLFVWVWSILTQPICPKSPSDLRGKEMSLSCDLGLYYKWPKSDPNAVFELPMRPKCSFWVPSCFIAANIVWTGQCDNSLFLWKLYNINQLDVWGVLGSLKVWPFLHCRFSLSPHFSGQRPAKWGLSENLQCKNGQTLSDSRTP